LKRFLADTVYRNAYLLILAAWLFTLSFIFANYFSYTTSPKGVKRTLERHLWSQERDLESLFANPALLGRLLSSKEGEEEAFDMIGKPYGLFMYTREPGEGLHLGYWNTQQALPTDPMLSRADGMYFDTLPNGQYASLLRRMEIGGRKDVLAYALIPIRHDYFIENDYLRKGFVNRMEIERSYTLSSSDKGIPIQDTKGRVLYRIEAGRPGIVGDTGWVTLLLRLIGSVLILFYLHLAAVGVFRHFGPLRALAFLVTSVVLLRALTYRLPFPFDTSSFELFNPAVYGSNVILKSLGDLLVNTLLFAWVMLFAQSIRASLPALQIRDLRLRLPMAAGLGLLLFYATWSSGNIIRSLVADSAISYEVTNFFKLDVYTALGFFAMGCISLGFFILSQILVQLLAQLMEDPVRNRVLLTVFTGLVYLTAFVDSSRITFGIALLAWLVVFMLLSTTRGGRDGRLVSGNSGVFWLVCFSLSITAVVFTENRRRELGIRKAAAERIAMQSDPSSAYLVNIATEGLNNDFLHASLPRFSDPGQSSLLKDSIINAKFKGYTNRFDTRLFLFDTLGRPLSASDQLTYDTLNTIFTMQGRKTAVPDMRYFEKDLTRMGYILRREVRDSSGAREAMFFMLSNPRNFRDEALYPELIRQDNDLAIDRWPSYAYAVYDSMAIRMHRNDYPFPLRLDPEGLPTDEFTNRVTGGYEVLWYRSGPGRFVVVTRKANFLLEAITLFAYLFCASLVLVAMFQLANFLLRSAYEGGLLRELRNISIRNQIYGTVIFLSLFSFVVIGAATILFFIQRYDRNNRDMLSRTIQVMSEEVESRMPVVSASSLLLRTGDSVGGLRWQELVAQISEIHNADINIYDEGGGLVVSSQPFVYNRGILSRRMDPGAYYNMKRLNRIQHVQQERYGQLEYLSVYKPLFGRDRQRVGFVNIPYFASTMGLKQEISNFLVAIINLNAFIFLIAGLISVVIANRITRSFSWIGRKMQEVNLGRHNEEILWPRRDEIGGLVDQYNLMVRKLEDSATALARTEREGAWREMARQVAHEIKNPLTPMKLSIQHLQRAIQGNAPNVRELSAGVAGTLIEQIEHLSRIAADFSEFANIAQARNEEFDLHEVLQSLASLHGTDERVRLVWHRAERSVPLYADRTQMNRLFTNLLRNAVESIPDERPGVVEMGETLTETDIVVSVKDNGLGIPPGMRSRIFTPNFTTKSSGTGLGLAISKGIVEQAGGDIWFETVTGSGTVFFVRLPLRRNEPVAEEANGV
jgi:signal transduction histidine kinase